MESHVFVREFPKRRQRPVAPHDPNVRHRHTAVMGPGIRIPLSVSDVRRSLSRIGECRMLRHLTPARADILRYLVTSTNRETGQCDPSQPTVADARRYGVATVKRAVADGLQLGILAVDDRVELRTCADDLKRVVPTSNAYAVRLETLLPTEPKPDGRRSGGTRWPNGAGAGKRSSKDQIDPQIRKEDSSFSYVGGVDNVDKKEAVNGNKALVDLSVVDNVRVELIDQLPTEVSSPVLSSDDWGLPAEPVANNRLAKLDHRSIDAADRVTRGSAQRQLRQIASKIAAHRAAKAVSTSLPCRGLPEAPEPVQSPGKPPTRVVPGGLAGRSDRWTPVAAFGLRPGDDSG